MSATDGILRTLLLRRRTRLLGASGLLARMRIPSFRKRVARSAVETQQSAAAEKVLQQVTRVRLPNGKIEIRGTLLAEFPAGERHTKLYISFCPPFDLLPTVSAELMDDMEAE